MKFLDDVYKVAIVRSQEEAEKIGYTNWFNGMNHQECTVIINAETGQCDYKSCSDITVSSVFYDDKTNRSFIRFYKVDEFLQSIAYRYIYETDFEYLC